MRLQDTGEDEAAGGKAFEGSLTLPASREVYEALLPEAGEGADVSFENGRVEMRFQVGSLRDTMSVVHSWLRLYKTLRRVEKQEGK